MEAFRGGWDTRTCTGGQAASGTRQGLKSWVCMGSSGFVFLRKTAFLIAPGRIFGFVWYLFFAGLAGVGGAAALQVCWTEGGFPDSLGRTTRGMRRLDWGTGGQATSGTRCVRLVIVCWWAVPTLQVCSLCCFVISPVQIPRARRPGGKRSLTVAALILPPLSPCGRGGLGQHNNNFAGDRYVD
jgi:hypothetical protein